MAALPYFDKIDPSTIDVLLINKRQFEESSNIGALAGQCNENRDISGMILRILAVRIEVNRPLVSPDHESLAGNVFPDARLQSRTCVSRSPSPSRIGNWWETAAIPSSTTGIPTFSKTLDRRRSSARLEFTDFLIFLSNFQGENCCFKEFGFGW